jgi:O-antigen ligase
LWLLSSVVVWTALTAAWDEGRGGRLCVLFAGAGAAYLGARLLALLSAFAVPLAIVAIGAAVICLSPPSEAYSSGPLAGPFGYSNMSGAFFAECAIAGLMLALGRTRSLRALGVAAAGAFVGVAIATQSRTALSSLLVVPVLWWVKSKVGTRRAVMVGAAITLAAIVVSIGLASTYAPHRNSPIDKIVNAAISERRIQLAHDGWTLMLDHPLRGVGADRFAAASPVAAQDTDSQWAHNDFLQMGAETGVVGIILLLLLFGWALARLATHSVSRSATVLAAGGVTILAITMCVDHIFKGPGVVTVTAALIGAAVGPPRWLTRLVDREPVVPET